jgi:hypothetical protein
VDGQHEPVAQTQSHVSLPDSVDAPGEETVRAADE